MGLSLCSYSFYLRFVLRSLLAGIREKTNRILGTPHVAGSGGLLYALERYTCPHHFSGGDERIARDHTPGMVDCPQRLARAVAVALAGGVLLVVSHAAATTQSMQKQILNTSQGKIDVTDLVAFEEYVWIQQHTRPSEYFWAAFPDVYFYLDLRNPTPLPFITNTGYTTVEQVAEVIRGLQLHRPHYIAWSPSDVDVTNHWIDPSDDHLGPLRNYLHTHYRLVNAFKGSDEIWERKE
jgi:hypothetical protein